MIDRAREFQPQLSWHALAPSPTRPLSNHKISGLTPSNFLLRISSLEGALRSVVLKHVQPVIAAVDHMIDRAREFQPQLSWHALAPSPTRPLSNHKISGLTPSNFLRKRGGRQVVRTARGGDRGRRHPCQGGRPPPQGPTRPGAGGIGKRKPQTPKPDPFRISHSLSAGRQVVRTVRGGEPDGAIHARADARRPKDRHVLEPVALAPVNPKPQSLTPYGSACRVR